MIAAPANILAAAIDMPGQLVPILARLNRGEAVSFSHEEGGPLAFVIEKTGCSFVVRDDRSRALASGATFAEIWRERPRPTDQGSSSPVASSEQSA